MQRNLHCFFRSEGRLIAGTIRFFDLFSGIGGFREGLHRAGGFTCVGHCEADAYADHNYRVLFDTEGEWFCNDARNIETERMPDFDLLCAGFPCQAFSIAGRREGFADARGTLFFEVARLVADKRPAYFLLENVPGLLSHDKGRTFHTILSTLSELGYHVEIFEYAGPYKKNMYVATVVVLVSVLMGILPFVLAYQVISPLVMGDSVETEFVLLRVIGVLICLVLQAFFYGWGLSISHKAAYNTLFRLRVSLQKKFEKLPLGIVEEKGTGTIKKLFVDDVDSLELLLAHSVPEGIANLLIPLVIYVAMFCADWKLALMSLASIPISLLSMVIMYSVGMKRMGPYYQSAQKMNNTIIEYINGMEVVKVFNKDADSYERFRKDVSDYRDYTLAWYKAAWPWMAIYSSLLPCTIILTLPVGAWFVLSGWSTLPNLILVLCLSLSIGMPLLKSLGFLPTMPQLNYKISALEQVLDAPELQQTEDAFHGKDDTITYDHVSFAYQTTQPGPDGKPVVIEDEVLHDISFTAKAGQKTALVGESGSGKSTLAKLLIHYYDPQKGSISIGGQKLCDMSLEALNSRISYVAQDQYLFNTSLLENIRLGRLNATDEEVVEAAKKAQCMEFLEKLPQGIHSMAGDAGKMLSGGQRQRISLARAILKDAPIVVLDEATAYADPENEEKMEAAIAELVKGKTLVVIAHKLPAIMNADQICVMDHGKLVATGKHQELIQSCPEYQKLWKAAQDSAEWKVHTAKEGK